MSEEKDLPILSDVPEEPLLSGGEELAEISPPVHQPELVAPTEMLLLVDHSTEPESMVDSRVTTPSGKDGSSVISSDTIPDMSDPSIFDAIHPSDTGVAASLEQSQDAVGDSNPKASDNSIKPELITSQEENSLVTPAIEVSTPQSIQTVEPTVSYNQPPSYTLVWIVVGVVLFAIGAGSIWYIFAQDDTQGTMQVEHTVSSEIPPVATYTDTVNETIISEEKDIENMNRALSENSSPLCDTIQNQSRKTECSETLKARTMASSGSVQDCQSLTLPDIRSNCISVVVQSSAITALDRSLCSQIDDAVQASYCGELVDQKLLAQLIETNTVSSDTCGRLTDKYKAQCLMAVKQTDDSTLLQDAIAQENLDACKSLSTEDLQITCFDTILLKQALKSGDKNLCDYVRDEGKKTTCLSYMNKKDDSAVFKSAIVEKNLSMCSEITVESLKNRCHDSVTLLLVRDTKNPLLCDTLIATGSIESCKKSTGGQ